MPTPVTPCRSHVHTGMAVVQIHVDTQPKSGLLVQTVFQNVKVMAVHACLHLQVIKRQLEEGVERRRVGLISQGAPARQHSDILTEDGQKVEY
jgi:hypothetical protein